MKLMNVARRNPLLCVLAVLVTAALLATSEISQWRSRVAIESLASADATAAHIGAAGLRPALDELATAMSWGRAGLWGLALAGLLALYLFLRHGLTLREHEDALQRVFQAEHERLEAEVRERTTQLTELTRHLLRAREDERHRLARDLHDELGALLTSAKLDAARLQAQLGPDASPAHERLAHLVGALDASISLGRRIVEDLRPSTLSHLGLPAALEMLLRDSGQGPGLQVHMALEPVPLSASAELVVYRLVQEAVTNLRKHAQAHEVWVDLHRAGGRVVVSVRDDGRGFDNGHPPLRAFGLLGMRQRVESEGGTLEVVSSPGQGTEVRASLPESA